MRSIIYDMFNQMADINDINLYMILSVIFLIFMFFKHLIKWLFQKRTQKVNLKTKDFEANFENANPFFILLLLALGKSKENKK